MMILFTMGCGCNEDDDDDSQTPPTDDDDDDDDSDDDDTDNPFEDIPVDATYNFPNLTGPVEVIKTDHGIPHIYSSNKSDLMFVVGYITSQNRFFQMDFLRHLTKGRLTEYLSAAGDDVLYADIAMRTRFMSPNGELVFNRIEELLPDDQVALLQSFSDGVTAYISDIKTGDNGVILPNEYLGTIVGMSGVIAEDIPDWEISDIFAIARYQQWDLSSTLGMELEMGQLYSGSVPAGVLEDVIRFQPIEETVILPDFYAAKGKGGAGMLPQHYSDAEIARIRTAYDNMPTDVRAHMEAIDHGSNNWVVSGDYTSSGNPLLANDPHLSFLNPSVFMEIHMDTAVFGNEDVFSAYGVLFPGIPAIMIGMNQNIAWGVTMAGYDVEDLYLETLNNPDPTLATAVTFNGNDVDIEYSEQVFQIGPKSDSPTETVNIPFVPHHGPFLYGSVEDSGGMTNKWTGHEPTNDLPAFLDLLWAEDMNDFMEAVSNFQVGAQNFVGIDMEGNIAYYPHAKVPIRDMPGIGIPPWLPMPGEGDHEWTGYIADEDLPQMMNPDEGYIITANNDMVGTLQDNDPNNDDFYLYWDRAVGYRAKRIDDLLTAAMAGKATLDMDEMQTIQNDTLAMEAQRFLSHLSDAADNDPATVTALGLGDAIAALEAWDFSTPIGIEHVDGTQPTAEQIQASVATTIFYAFWTRMPYAVFNDEFDDLGAVAYDAPMPGRPALWYLLENSGTSQTGDDLFDNTDTVPVETRDDILLQTLADAIAWCESEDGFDTADMTKWNWGKIHTTTWFDFFASLDVSLAMDIKGPYPLDGTAYTVDVAKGTGFKGMDCGPVYDFSVSSGPQVRWVVEATEDGMVARNVIPGGEESDISATYYNDQANLWLTNKTHDVRFTVEDVIENALERHVFTP